MTPRALFTTLVDAPLVRRRRKSDGALFGVVKLRERDRMSDREWIGFINDPEIIERFEALRVNEPVAVVGPFNAVARADGAGVEFRITVEALLDLKRPKKTKRAISREERVRSDEADGAPVETGETVLDDPLPF